MGGAEILDACQRGDWAAARLFALQALARPDVDRAHLHALIGKIAWQLADRDEAMVHLEAAVDRGVDDPTAWALLAELQDHRPDRRIQLLARAAAHPRGTGDHALALARAYCDTGRAEDGLPWLARAADDPRSAAQALALAAEIGLQSGDLDLVADTIGRFEALVPSADPLLMAQVVPQVAPLLRECPALDALIERLAVAAAPTLLVCQWRAQRHLAGRDPQGAVAWAERAVALDPESAEAQRLLGEVRLLAGDIDGGEAALWLADQRTPLPPTPLLAVADARRRRGNLTEALRIAEIVRDRHPDDAGAWLELGRLYADLGRDEEGEAAVVRAMALDGRVDAQAGRSTQFLRAALDGLPQALAALGEDGSWQVDRLRMGHNALLVQLAASTGVALFAKVTLPGRRDRDHVRATAELEARLAAMSGTETAVPKPRCGADGEYAVSLAGGWMTASAAIDGVSLRRTLADPRATMTPAHAESLGRALGDLHAACAEVRDWRRPPSGLSSAVGPLLELHNDGAAWPRLRTLLGLVGPGEAVGDALEAHVEFLLPRLAALCETLPHGIVHGDFGWHNATWSGASVRGVVDFDYAAWDHPLVDLAQAVARTAFDWKRLATLRDPAPRMELAWALTHGYQQRGGLQLVDDEGLWILVAACRLAYGLALARAAIDNRDPRAPQHYGPALDGLDLLTLQLRWLKDAALRGPPPLFKPLITLPSPRRTGAVAAPR
ncbi:MAG: phosphotransferase [Deltaproteobacteria bacterium]|nr:phosphotransferase [Deltaproteobacteria bacterium]